MNEENPISSLVIEPTAPVVELGTALYGLMAEFEEHEQVLAAARRAYAAGYRSMDAFSPFPVEGLAEALGHYYTSVPLFTLMGGIAGGLGGYFLQWYSMSKIYPLNVGGRPLNSWPNFIPITFELTILIAALSALVAMLVLNRLPEPHRTGGNEAQAIRAHCRRALHLPDVAPMPRAVK